MKVINSQINMKYGSKDYRLTTCNTCREVHMCELSKFFREKTSFKRYLELLDMYKIMARDIDNYDIGVTFSSTFQFHYRSLSDRSEIESIVYPIIESILEFFGMKAEYSVVTRRNYFKDHTSVRINLGDVEARYFASLYNIMLLIPRIMELEELSAKQEPDIRDVKRGLLDYLIISQTRNHVREFWFYDNDAVRVAGLIDTLNSIGIEDRLHFMSAASMKIFAGLSNGIINSSGIDSISKSYSRHLGSKLCDIWGGLT